MQEKRVVEKKKVFIRFPNTKDGYLSLKSAGATVVPFRRCLASKALDACETLSM